MLFQKPIQDPSTRLRLGRDDSLWPPKLCATKNRHNYLKFCAFAKKNRSFFDKPRLQRLPKRSSVPQKKLCATKHGIGGPGGLPWSPQGRGEDLRERGKLRVEKVGFPSPFCLTTLQKVEFALLFQKPIQDPSTRLRLGRDDRLWPPKLCATKPPKLCATKLRRTIAKSAAFCSFGTRRW